MLDNSYACEHAVSAEKTCTFRVGKVILQREIPKEQVQKLITTGKTDLLPKFISKKGRAFSAHLKLENGKVGFEFAEKKPRREEEARGGKACRSLIAVCIDRGACRSGTLTLASSTRFSEC